MFNKQPKLDISLDMKKFAEPYKKEAYRQAKEKAIILNLSKEQEKELIENIDEFFDDMFLEELSFKVSFNFKA